MLIRHSALTPLLLFLAIALAWTWPLPLRLGSRIAVDPGDPVLNSWILWWNTQALPFTAEWWSPPIFQPMTGALALSEHLLGIAVLFFPVALVAGPVAAYNSALIASVWLSGFFAYLLARRLTGSGWAGVVAGLAFALAPYRAGQLSHLQVLTSQWMPLALLAAHGYLEERRRRWLAVFAAAWLLQATSNGYFLLFFPVLLGLWLLWFGTGAAARRHRRRPSVHLAVTFVAASLPLIPLLIEYRRVHGELGITRAYSEMVMFSAGVDSFASRPSLLAFWPASPSPNQETLLFTGVTVLLVVAAGAFGLLRSGELRASIAARSPGVFYAAAAVVMAWLAMGPSKDPDATAEILLRPYTLLTWLPGFYGLRAPARFGMLAAFCLAIAAGCAVARLTGGRRRWRPALAAAAAAGVLLDGWIERMPLVRLPVRIVLPDIREASVLELPADDLRVNVGAMYRQMSHGYPVVNGYSGYIPLHYRRLTASMRQSEPGALRRLARGHPLMVVVHTELDPLGHLRTWTEEEGGVQQGVTPLGPVYVIPPQYRARQEP
jgi:hypothetical protein